ncbi:MAG: glycosyltransferase family 4 protein [Anaerolineae bacterium]|nr:glycosyltransferase family 4 protein [Anaerolineae bacterium]
MRILFFLSYYKPYIGGAENAFIRLAEGLARRNHEITVVTSRLPGTASSEVINGVYVKRISVPKRGDRYFLPLFSLWYMLRYLPRFDCVHTASHCLTVTVYWMAKLYGCPIIFTSHEIIGNRWDNLCTNKGISWLYQRIEKLIARLNYDHCVAVSQATLSDLVKIGIDESKASVIYWGVDEVFSKDSHMGDMLLRQQLQIPLDSFLYVYFGRPGVTKGVDLLVEAAREINQRIPNSHLMLILGKEPHNLYLAICQRIKELNLRATVHLVPSASSRVELVEMLREANCIVVPSVTEGFGFTTAEACALDIPVVATRTGAIPEVISGRHLLVKPGHIHALVEGVLRAARGDYDYTSPKQFHWQMTLTAYEQLYERVSHSISGRPLVLRESLKRISRLS